MKTMGMFDVAAEICSPMVELWSLASACVCFVWVVSNLGMSCVSTVFDSEEMQADFTAYTTFIFQPCHAFGTS